MHYVLILLSIIEPVYPYLKHAKSNNSNFYSLEVVSHYRDQQLQVTKRYS